MSEWRTEPLKDIVLYISKGIPPAYVEIEGKNTVRVLNQKCNRDFTINYTESRLHDLGKRDVPPEKYLQNGDILINSTGTGTAGRIAQLNTVPYPTIVDGHMILIRGNEKVISRYLGYALKAQQAMILQLDEGSTGQTELNRDRLLSEIEVSYPVSLDEQETIVATLSALDDKIANNNAINHHLEQMAQAIFKSWFVDFEPFGGVMPEDWKIGKVEDFFDVSIGKTPPRKEPQWFTTNPQDVIWVSISDMGSCGVFISDSSEYLTAESVTKFNVKLVPSGTVLLSFKLTIGRVAITNGEMTTNEAIAHFKCSEYKLTEYVYCYLKVFDYQSLGNTSSIATAVNSKTIKAMPFLMPDRKTIEKFHAAITPVFEQIKVYLEESTRLATLRDTLLPCLMSGELSVMDIDNA